MIPGLGLDWQAKSQLISGTLRGNDPGATLEGIAHLAASWFSVPIALIRLDRARFRSLGACYGPRGDWGERELSLCAHTFEAGKPLVVPDLWRDERYRTCSLATGAVAVRYYAGFPIRGPRGGRLGTLCILDHRPRRFSSKRLSSLARLAELAARVLAAWLSMDRDTPPLIGTGGAEQRYRVLFDNATDMVYFHDLRGRLTAVNHTMERITGIGREELLEMNVTDLVTPSHREVVRQMVLEQFGGGVSRNYELDFLVRDGAPVTLEVSVHLLFERGRPVGLLGLGRQVASRERERRARKQAEEKYREVTDRLQRHRLQLRELHRLSTRLHGSRQSLFDDYLAAGCRMLDLPLGFIAELRGTDCWIRAEYPPATGQPGRRVVPLAETGFAGAIQPAATRWYHRRTPRGNRPIFEKGAAGCLMATPLWVGGRLFGVLCFADRAYRREPDPAWKEVIEVLGKGLSDFLSAEQVHSLMPAAATVESSLHREELVNALRNREFSLRYQPEVTADGSLAALEALLTWHHPALGEIPADRFIPVAEQTGLIVEIGAWVLEEACRRAAAWRRDGIAPVRLAVNVSAVQFERPDLVESVARTLAEHELEASLLELEITESAVIQDLEQAAGVMTRLRRLGVTISLDDFGTGYSSLSYLSWLPVDALKIDRSFLDEAHPPETTLPILRAITTLAHSLKLAVIGEGVEDSSQFELLKQAACDRFQGHLFGRPVSAQAAGRLLRSGRKLIPSTPSD